MTDLSSNITESYCSQTANESIEILYAGRICRDCHDFIVCKLAHSKCSKIVQARTELTSKISIPDFVKIFEASQNFINDSERICGRQISILRATLFAQVLRIINKL